MSIAVSGWVRADPAGDLLIVDGYLRGRDTFLTGVLDLDTGPVPVRILRFDDVTVLKPLTALPEPRADRWAGNLRLPHGQRPVRVPPELDAAVRAAGADLDHLAEPELRHMLTYVNEAADPVIRRQRVAVAVAGLARKA
jgi:hypothetical protein